MKEGKGMTREQKIFRLRKRHGPDTPFEQLSDEQIDEIYTQMFGTSITKNLTGVIKEDHERTKTVSDILEEVKQEICDDYCKYPIQVDSKEDLFADDSPCMTCPLSKL